MTRLQGVNDVGAGREAISRESAAAVSFISSGRCVPILSTQRDPSVSRFISPREYEPTSMSKELVPDIHNDV